MTTLHPAGTTISLHQTSVLIVCVLFLSTFRPVLGLADVSFTLISFSNPENKLQDGSYCNQNQTACEMKFLFDFKQPIALRLNSGGVTASTVNYGIGADAITTYNDMTAPNPFPADPQTDSEITTLAFIIRVFDYTSGNVLKVATFTVNEPVKFQVQHYSLSSGFSTFDISTNITCHTDYYGNCTVHCVAGATFSCDPATGAKVCKVGWSGPDCLTTVAVPCTVQSVVNNGSYSPQSSSYNAGDQITVTCDPGYLPTSTTLTCLSDGQWDTAWPTCSIAECAAVNALAQGTVTPTTATTAPSPYQTVVSFSCNSRYQLAGNTTLTCQADGTWDYAQPTCREIRCPPFTLTQYLDIIPSNKNFSTSAIGESVDFYCNSGYTLRGLQSLSCLDTGVWDGDMPYCVLIMCPQPRTTPLKGGGAYYARSPPPRTPDSVYFQICFGGNVGKGSATRTCQKNGTWDKNDLFVCLKKCDKITFDEGVVTYTSEMPAEGTTATFSCNDGSFLVGEDVTVCEEDGTWNLTVTPSCIAGCSLPDVISSTVAVTPQGFRNDDIMVGYTLSFSCSRDSFLTASSVLTCQDTGNWDGEFPACVPFVENIDATIKDLYIAGLSTLSGVFAVFVLTVFILVYFDRKVTKKSQTTTRRLSYAIAPNPLAFSPPKSNSFKMQHVVSSTAARVSPTPGNTAQIIRGRKTGPISHDSAPTVTKKNGNGEAGGVKKFVYKNPAFVREDF